MLLAVRQGPEVHFLVGTVIMGFLSIFKTSQASSPYEAMNSVASRGSKGCEAPCRDEADTYAFPRVSTGNSDMPSSCEMKQEPKFKPLQGNPAFL